MLKKAIMIFIVSLICNPMLAAKPIFVDTRLLLLAHPLFSDFDCITGRFKNTSSEFVAGGQKGVEELQDEIQKLTQWLLNSPKILQEKLRGIALPDRIATERAFLAEKRDIEQRISIMQMRAYMARLVPGRPGVTPDSSIFPQINQLASDIRAVLKKLKEKHSTQVVIDVAELLPVIEYAPTPTVLTQNLHSKLWKGDKEVADKDISSWFEEADLYWARRLGMDADIIPLGATDTRLEAIKLMEEQTKGLKK